MTKPIIKEINVETGVEVEREMTAAEIKQHDFDTANFAQQEADRIAMKSARETVLAKLGLTAEEAIALLS
jgi:hypothetical protein